MAPISFNLIGIGPGDPKQVTVEAVEAMRATDVFFLIEKGGPRDELAERRLEILAHHVPEGGYRVVRIAEQQRPRSGPYLAGVESWRSARARLLAQAIDRHLSPGQVGAILVWGDPSLYDGALAVLNEVVGMGVRLELRVIPGVSAPQALAARHRITLTRTAGEVLFTTGRRLAEGRAGEDPDLVVMLDGNASFRSYPDRESLLYWSAYLGLPGELSVAGPLAQVGEEVAALRERARRERGWIMDTYLLRRERG